MTPSKVSIAAGFASSGDAGNPRVAGWSHRAVQGLAR